MRIVHLAPHLGGGVGRVLLSWLDRARERTENKHAIYCLEDANPVARRQAAHKGIPLHDMMVDRKKALLHAMGVADILVIHWWNHPLLYDFLVNETLPSCRLVLWSHVAGHTAPHIFSRRLIEFADRFVVATPYSLEAPGLRFFDAGFIKERVRTVFTCAGTDRVAMVRPMPKENFTVGYIGTVDYCKLHTSFLRMSSSVGIPGVRFVVCGGARHEALQAEAHRMGVAECFSFTGPVDDITPYLSRFDVFGYPLCQGHYGTGEQALIEAQAAGVPAVVWDNGSERHVVEHGLTGLVVASADDYTAALELLYHDPALRRRLGTQARERALARFSLDAMVASWDAVFDELIVLPKRIRRWGASGPLQGASLYVESLGEGAGPFAVSCSDDKDSALAADRTIYALDGVFRSQTRGSTFHYRSLFPHDPYLNLWCGLIETALGAYEQALASFLAARGIDHWRIDWYTSRVLEALGRHREARSYLERAGCSESGAAPAELQHYDILQG